MFELACCCFVDAFEGLDGVGRVLDVTDAFGEGLVEVGHLAFEVLVEVADLVFERLVGGEDAVDFLDVAQEHLDGFVRCLEARLRVFGELADFLCDDGEPAAGFACARGLDGGVECEEVCLSGNLVDHLHDAVDFLRALREHVELRRDFVIAVDELGEELALFVDAGRDLLDGVLDDLDVVRHRANL